MLIELNKLVYRSVETNLLKAVQSAPKSWVRIYLKGRFWLQWSFLGLCAVMAWMPMPSFAQGGKPKGTLPDYVPFPNGGSPQPGATVLENQQWVSDATSTFDDLWDTYLTINSPFFGMLLRGMSYIVATGFLFWSVSVTWDWVNSNYQKFPWQKLFTPILIIFLFANGGQLTIVGLQAYKHLVYGANNQMLSETYGGLSGAELIKQVNTQEGLKRAYEKKLEGCKDQEPEAQKACLKEVETEIQAASQKLKKKNKGWNLDLGQALTGFAQSLIAEFLTLMAITFHLIMAYCLAVWASSAPIWIALGLYPAGKSSLQIFISGLFSAMLSIWLYTILQIALASQMNSGLGVHGVMFPLLGGVVNPLVALFAGSMGFSSVMAAASVAGGGAFKLLKGMSPSPAPQQGAPSPAPPPPPPPALPTPSPSR